MDTPKRVNLKGTNDSVKFGLIICVICVKTEIDRIIEGYIDVLGEEIGCLPEEYAMEIDETMTPATQDPHSLPAVIRDQLKRKLDHLERYETIVQETEPTNWLNSLVCVRKKNGRIRICIDPTELNKAIHCEHYPMNSFEDVASRLCGNKYFTTIDAIVGYYQLKMSKPSSKSTSFNTPFGRYRYLRMSMRAKCSSKDFERCMEMHFGSIQGAEMLVDDIMVHGRTF